MSHRYAARDVKHGTTMRLTGSTINPDAHTRAWTPYLAGSSQTVDDVLMMPPGRKHLCVFNERGELSWLAKGGKEFQLLQRQGRGSRGR